MAWYGLVDQTTGELRSVGSEAMFTGKDIANVPAGTIRHDFGANRPEFATQRWNSTTRSMEARPAPVMKDRRDDLQALFQANPDFLAVWNSLNAARKNQLRAGLRTVLGQFLGGQTMRQDAESVEI